MQRDLLSLAAIAAIAFAGCGGEQAEKPAARKPAGVFDYSAAPAPAAAAPVAPPVQPVPPPTELVKAEPGVGEKGRGYGGGLITEPVHQYFMAKQRIAFDIQLVSAMNLYKAEHEKGPKTHEDFMRDIIKKNEIPLPELPEGERYLYDPKTEQLMVERPAGGNQDGKSGSGK